MMRQTGFGLWLVFVKNDRCLQKKCLCRKQEDGKTIFIIKGEEFPKLIIPIMAINKEYTKDEFLERFTNIEVINI